MKDNCIYMSRALWKKGIKCICKKYRFRSACAVRAGWPWPKHLAIVQFSGCPSACLPYDYVDCKKKSLWMPDHAMT